MNGQKVFKDASVITLPVPVGGVVVGQPYEIGGFFGFSQATVKAADADGSLFTLDRTGIFMVSAKATADINVGDAIYYDSTVGNVLQRFGDAGSVANTARFVGYAAFDTRTGTTLTPSKVLSAGATGYILVDVMGGRRQTKA